VSVFKVGQDISTVGLYFDNTATNMACKRLYWLLPSYFNITASILDVCELTQTVKN